MRLGRPTTDEIDEAEQMKQRGTAVYQHNAIKFSEKSSKEEIVSLWSRRIHGSTSLSSPARLGGRQMAALFGVACLLCFASCSTVNETTGLDIPSPNVGKTGMGALTGAAVGGGLGLIVGSTSGNAGEGLLVGSLAGGALGAGIGAQMAHNDADSLESGRENVVRQGETIQKQERDLRDLKNTTRDQSPIHDVDITKPPTVKPGVSKNTIGKSLTSKKEEDILPSRYASETTISPKMSEKSAPLPAQSPGARGRLALSSKSAVLNAPSGLKRATPFGGKALESHDLKNGEQKVSNSRGMMEVAKQEKGTQAISRSSKTEEARNSEIERGGSGVSSLNAKTNTAVEENRNLSKDSFAVQAPAAQSSGTQGTTNAKGSSAALAEIFPKKTPHETTLPAATVAPGEVKAALGETNKELGKAPRDQANCKEALSEAERGLNASSDADRLFYLRRAARLCPSEPTYHVELGKLYGTIGKNDDAKFELRQAIDLDANNQVARDELSIIENAGNISR